MARPTVWGMAFSGLRDFSRYSRTIGQTKTAGGDTAGRFVSAPSRDEPGIRFAD